MVPHPVGIGSRYQGDETAKESQGLEDELGRAVGGGPGAAQVVADVAVGGEGEALEGEGSAKAVAAQILDPLSIVGGHGAGGVKREPLDAGAQGFGLRLGAERLEEGLGRQRGTKRLAHGISEEGLIVIEAGGGLLELRQEFLREGDEAGGDDSGELLDLLVGGRRQR
jgi:hypothetical protein